MGANRLDFNNVPQRIGFGNYQCNVPWNYLERSLSSMFDDIGLELEPEFQRGHVWTVDQQIAYVEFRLSGGNSGRDILFNCPNWMRANCTGPVVCVDGLQRLTAVRKFMNDELPIFGGYTQSMIDNIRYTSLDFIFHVNSLTNRHDVYRWYLELNEGGTPHTEAELDKVRKLMKQ